MNTPVTGVIHVIHRVTDHLAHTHEHTTIRQTLLAHKYIYTLSHPGPTYPSLLLHCQLLALFNQSINRSIHHSFILIHLKSFVQHKQLALNHSDSFHQLSRPTTATLIHLPQRNKNIAGISISLYGTYHAFLPQAPDSFVHASKPAADKVAKPDLRAEKSASFSSPLIGALVSCKRHSHTHVC